MAKIKLGQRPANIPHVVKFTNLDGTKDALRVHYVYRTRDEFNKFTDEHAAAQKVAEAGFDADTTLQERGAAGAKSDAAYLLGALEWWELEDEITEANLIVLINQAPQAAREMIGAYQTACVSGRLGN